MRLSPPIRDEYEIVLTPLDDVPLERTLSLPQRIWQQGWVRKIVILLTLALIWEVIARIQNNDLLLPSFVQTAQAFVDGVSTGELLVKVWISLKVLIKGYLIGIEIGRARV